MKTDTPRMKEAWARSSRTSDGRYSTDTPMRVYAESCYEEGCALERELTTARAEMHKSIEERREESMKATAARSGLEMWKRCSQKAEQELVTVTEQRDRLAEALERILEYQGRFAEEDPESIAREALQSLTLKDNE
jgi:hypothetical protein